MAHKTMHIGIGIDYLIDQVNREGNRYIEVDGSLISDVEALNFLRGERDAGRRLSSSCPTPEADGSCPGHPADQAEAERLGDLKGA